MLPDGFSFQSTCKVMFFSSDFKFLNIVSAASSFPLPFQCGSILKYKRPLSSVFTSNSGYKSITGIFNSLHSFKNLL